MSDSLDDLNFGMNAGDLDAASLSGDEKQPDVLVVVKGGAAIDQLTMKAIMDKLAPFAVKAMPHQIHSPSKPPNKLPEEQAMANEAVEPSDDETTDQA